MGKHGGSCQIGVVFYHAALDGGLIVLLFVSCVRAAVGTLEPGFPLVPNSCTRAISAFLWRNDDTLSTSNAKGKLLCSGGCASRGILLSPWGFSMPFSRIRLYPRAGPNVRRRCNRPPPIPTSISNVNTVDKYSR